MHRLRAAATEADMHTALRSLHLESDVILWEAIDDSVLGLHAVTSADLVGFATLSAAESPELWSRRNRRQYRWALMRSCAPTPGPGPGRLSES